MNGKAPKNPKASQPQDDDAPYEVGYGKPPVASRFTPGRSGNAKGRPKGAMESKPGEVVGERLKELVLEEAYRTIPIREDGHVIEIPVMRAALRSLALNAAKGKQRSQRMLIDLLSAVEGERRGTREKLFATVVDYKNYWDAEIALARSKGLVEPSPLPHPNNLFVDPLTGFVVSRGPWNEEEKAHWDTVTALKSKMVVKLKEMEKQLRLTPDDESLHEKKRTITSILARADTFLSAEQVLVANGAPELRRKSKRRS